MDCTHDRRNYKIVNLVQAPIFWAAISAKKKRASTAVSVSVREKLIGLIYEELNPAPP